MGIKKLYKKNKVGKTAKIQNKHNMWNKLVKGIELVRKWLMECLKHLSSISILGVAIIYQIILLCRNEEIKHGYIYMAILGILFFIKALLSLKGSIIISRIAIVIIWIRWLYAPKFIPQCLADIALNLLLIIVLNKMVSSINEWLQRLKQDDELEDYEIHTFYDNKAREIKTSSEFEQLKHDIASSIKNRGIDIKELEFQVRYILDKKEEKADNLKTALFPSLAVFVGAYFGCITMFLGEAVNDKGIAILIALAVALLLTLIISEVQVRRNHKAWIMVSYWRNILDAIKEIESNK